MRKLSILFITLLLLSSCADNNKPPGPDRRMEFVPDDAEVLVMSRDSYDDFSIIQCRHGVVVVTTLDGVDGEVEETDVSDQSCDPE